MELDAGGSATPDYPLYDLESARRLLDQRTTAFRWEYYLSVAMTTHGGR